MTTNATGIDNRVRQLDNEVQSIYEILGMRFSVADQHSAERDAATEVRLQRIENRLDEVLDLLRGQRD